MVENKETLGKKIQLLRQEKNISQKELAELIEKTTADVATWEADETTPSIADIVKLSSAFGKTTDYLLVESSLPEESEKEKAKEETTTLVEPKPEVTDNKKPASKKKIIPLIIVLAILLAAAGVVAYMFNRPFSKNTKAIKRVTSSVVKIICYDYRGEECASGSGFIAFDDSTVVTNYHVMADAYTCKISTEEDKTFNVKDIIAYSKENDIAIIGLEEPTNLAVLSFDESDKIMKGETVTAIGSPLGIKNTVSQGVLSGRLMEGEMDVLQFTAAISHGSSGGALFNENGNVIGVTFASYVDGQNLNLAIPSELVKKVYDEKTESSSIDSIYLTEHPFYRKLLSIYKDAVEVTFEDLKNNPNKYNGKIIVLNTYISSFIESRLNKFITTEHVHYWGFVSNAENVSGSYEYDEKVRNDDSLDYSEKPFIGMIFTFNPEDYEDEIMCYGDSVTIVGLFNYDEAGKEDYVLYDWASIDVKTIKKN